MRVSMIVAMDRNALIGAQGRLPWRLPGELRYFKRTTMGKPILMGRTTHESIGRALPGRTNIVLTTQRDYAAPGCTVVHDVESAIAAAYRALPGDSDATSAAGELMVIGGALIYAAMLPYSTRLYRTVVQETFDGDCYFPKLDDKDWRLIESNAFASDDVNPHAYELQILERIGQAAPLPTSA